MASNTITYTVKDLVDLGIIEKPLDGNHGGIHPKSSDYVEDGVPFIMASDLIDGHVDIKGCKFITEEQATSLRKGFAKEGDVLLSHKATIGRTAIVGELPTGFIVLTPQITYYRVLDSTRLNPRYLKYYFDSEAFQALFEQWAGGGSTRLYLGITEQMKLPIELPEITIQNKIVDLVDSFDRKITLNRQINQTLEQIAQALFKSWFVDFDLVVDNALDAGFFEQDVDLPDELLRRAEARRSVREHGNFKPLLDATRQLFPAAFEDCAEPSLGVGGWVPEGWAASIAGDELTVKGGSTPSTANPEFWEGGDINWTSPKDLSGKAEKVMLDTERKITKEGLKKITSGLLPAETVLMSSRAPVGYLALSKIPVAINQGYIAITETKSLTQEYALYWLDSKVEIIKSISGGTTFAEISKKTFRTIPIIVPDFTVVDAFSEVVGLNLMKISKNVEEISSLCAIRDSLLPKLISGELEIR
ncbi:restriction endonuclease subunit S [Shewanella baltica]|uniref:restriction endonuclease subunit S n=1 Tax=Shewanella baltica TaxID=62322 RepID=UPI00217D9915|nr:restriction endonuclease subunit S [Shewanella baltica]MCS6159239.1 restriction endonuclease subunit S [Shewanella baltica]